MASPALCASREIDSASLILPATSTSTRSEISFISHAPDWCSLRFETGDLLAGNRRGRRRFRTAQNCGAFAGAERIWHVDVRQCVLRQAILPLRFNSGEPSPSNLATGSWSDGHTGLPERSSDFRISAGMITGSRGGKSFPDSCAPHGPIGLSMPGRPMRNRWGDSGRVSNTSVPSAGADSRRSSSEPSACCLRCDLLEVDA